MCKSQSGGGFQWLIPIYCVRHNMLVNLGILLPMNQTYMISVSSFQESLKQLLEIDDAIIYFGGLLLIPL